jgi:hypothetical protein
MDSGWCRWLISILPLKWSSFFCNASKLSFPIVQPGICMRKLLQIAEDEKHKNGIINLKKETSKDS